MLATDYFRNEPIPSSIHGLDDQWVPSVVYENAAQFPDTGGQCPIADDHVRPDGGKEFGFADDSVRMGRQITEHGERFHRQGKLLLVPPHTLVAEVQEKVAKVQEFCR